MIDEKKLIEEIQARHDFWINKSAKCIEDGNTFKADMYNIMTAELNTILHMIEGQPKAGEWIPCSERLPDEEARQYIINNLDGIGYLYPCLLTYRSPNTEKVHVVRFYYDINMQCFVNHGEKMCEKARCIAWMPLPEPWEGDSK